MIGNDFAAVTVGQDIAKDRNNNRMIGLRFGTGGGDAVLKSATGATVTISNVQTGETFPCSVLQVASVTGTVANIVAIFQD